MLGQNSCFPLLSQERSRTPRTEECLGARCCSPRSIFILSTVCQRLVCVCVVHTTVVTSNCFLCLTVWIPFGADTGCLGCLRFWRKCKCSPEDSWHLLKEKVRLVTALKQRANARAGFWGHLRGGLCFGEAE